MLTLYRHEHRQQDDGGTNRQAPDDVGEEVPYSLVPWGTQCNSAPPGMYPRCDRSGYIDVTEESHSGDDDGWYTWRPHAALMTRAALAGLIMARIMARIMTPAPVWCSAATRARVGTLRHRSRAADQPARAASMRPCLQSAWNDRATVRLCRRVVGGQVPRAKPARQPHVGCRSAGPAHPPHLMGQLANGSTSGSSLCVWATARERKRTPTPHSMPLSTRFFFLVDCRGGGEVIITIPYLVESHTFFPTGSRHENAVERTKRPPSCRVRPNVRANTLPHEPHRVHRRCKQTRTAGRTRRGVCARTVGIEPSHKWRRAKLQLIVKVQNTPPTPPCSPTRL